MFKMIDKIKWLFTKYQVNKITLLDGDILVIKPPENVKWNNDKGVKMHEFVRETLEKSGYKNLNITFLEDINLGVISKSKE